MYRILFTLFLFSCIVFSAKAQSVKGVLKDKDDNTAVQNATVNLNSANSPSKSFSSVTDSKGNFIFNSVPAGDYTLTATSVGYQTAAKVITVNGEVTDLGLIKITKTAKTLQTVVVNGAPPPVKQNGDTLDYAAAQFKVNPDATSEDLIKKDAGNYCG